MDSMTRPEWANVAQYTDSRVAAEGLAEQIRALGFAVVELENGYSVANSINDQKLTDPTQRILPARQLSVFTVTADGAFRFGWVEHPDGNGRTDYHDFQEYLEALTYRTARRPS